MALNCSLTFSCCPYPGSLPCSPQVILPPCPSWPPVLNTREVSSAHHQTGSSYQHSSTQQYHHDPYGETAWLAGGRQPEATDSECMFCEVKGIGSWGMGRKKILDTIMVWLSKSQSELMESIFVVLKFHGESD